nr:RNA pseudouridine synthase [Bacteroidota bacterium]
MVNEILYEDNHIIIVNKNPGDIVQADIGRDPTLRDAVKKYVKQKYNKPGDVFLGIVHRLDRPVSGAIIMARTSKALSRLNKIFRNREVKKTYWAVVDKQPPEKEGHLVHYLKKTERINKSFVVAETQPGALRAELIYRYLAGSERYFLLEIELLTGRHHQIRAQLAAIGCYIKGDLKYGFPRSNPNASIHLHARKIEFVHPVKNEPVVVVANPPADPVWDFFVRHDKNPQT